MWRREKKACDSTKLRWDWQELAHSFYHSHPFDQLYRISLTCYFNILGYGDNGAPPKIPGTKSLRYHTLFKDDSKCVSVVSYLLNIFIYRWSYTGVWSGVDKDWQRKSLRLMKCLKVWTIVILNSLSNCNGMSATIEIIKINVKTNLCCTTFVLVINLLGYGVV